MCLISGIRSTPLPWLPVLSSIELPAIRRKAATDKLVEKIVKHDRTTEQGHCGACRRKWRLIDTDLCPCGETQTMSHIVESCPLTKLNGGLSRLHSADEIAGHFVADQLWFMIRIITRRRRFCLSANFCRAMLCISAAYAVMRCLCVCLHVRGSCENE